MKRILGTAISMLLAVAVFNAKAGDRGTPEEAIAMVQKVIQSIKIKGRAQTIEDVNSKKYVDRDLYISIVDDAGNNVANSIHPRMIGKNILEMKDVDGKFFVKEARDLVKIRGKGWIDYNWPNPMTNQIEKKSLYTELHDGLSISCGIFKPKH